MKNKKIYGKLLLDLVLFVLLSLMYRKNAIGMRFHELGGLALCGLFLIHKALNWKWIRGVTAGMIRRNVKLNVCWVVDVLLLASMTAVLVTGLLISKTLPTAIAGARGLQAWHYFFAAASLALSGIHLGLHGAYLKNRLWNALPLPETARKTAGILLLCVLFCFGSFHLATTGFASQFTRPFVSMTIPQGGGHPDFEKMERAPEDGRGEGRDNGSGKGMGNGMENAQGESMKRPEQAQHGVSASSAVSTFAAYASILCWFAILTAVLSSWFQKRHTHHNSKEESGPPAKPGA